MGPLEPDIGLFRFFVHMEAEVAGVHFEGLVDPVDEAVGALESVRREDGEELAHLARHDLQPGNVLARLLTVDDVGPVQANTQDCRGGNG